MGQGDPYGQHQAGVIVTAPIFQAWNAAAQTLSAVERWLSDGRPRGTVVEDFDGPPPTLRDGESVIDAIERLRHRGRELRADIHRIRSSCFPSSHCKEKAKKQILAPAARGAPVVAHLIEHDGDITWRDERRRRGPRNAHRVVSLRGLSPSRARCCQRAAQQHAGETRLWLRKTRQNRSRRFKQQPLVSALSLRSRQQVLLTTAPQLLPASVRKNRLASFRRRQRYDRRRSNEFSH